MFTLCWNCGQVHADRPDAVATTCRGCQCADAMVPEPDFKTAQAHSAEVKIALGKEAP